MRVNYWTCNRALESAVHIIRVHLWQQPVPSVKHWSSCGGLFLIVRISCLLCRNYVPFYVLQFTLPCASQCYVIKDVIRCPSTRKSNNLPHKIGYKTLIHTLFQSKQPFLIYLSFCTVSTLTSDLFHSIKRTSKNTIIYISNHCILRYNVLFFWVTKASRLM